MKIDEAYQSLEKRKDLRNKNTVEAAQSCDC